MALDFLPAAGAGTMPGAVPGQGELAPGPSPAVPMGADIPGMLPPELGGGGPADQQYVAVTQEDGSVLLHMKRPDGSLGPVVKIVNAPKPKKPPGA
jgi:hypothetical protein